MANFTLIFDWATEGWNFVQNSKYASNIAPPKPVGFFPALCLLLFPANLYPCHFFLLFLSFSPSKINISGIWNKATCCLVKYAADMAVINAS